MSLKNMLTLMTMICLLTAGCGKSDAVVQTEDGIEMTMTANTAQAKFPKIEFTATKRPTPKSVEEAESSIKAIRDLYDWSRVPPALNQNLTKDSVFQFVKSMKLLQSQLPHDIEWLKSLDVDSIPGIDRFTSQTVGNAKKSALDRLEQYLPRDMEHSLKYTREFLITSFNETQMFTLKKGAECDMTNQSEVRNTLGRENINQLREDSIKRIATAFDAIEFFDEQLGYESDFSTEKQTFVALVKQYKSNLDAAAAAIQPPADIGDKNLAKIAAEVLADKKYKLAKPVRIIVNAPKKSHMKDHYTIDFGERSIEKSPYRWEEFQVATIEKEGDQHYLWYNTMLYYEVGPHTVPTKKWVLGPRHKSAPILEENINN